MKKNTLISALIVILIAATLAVFTKGPFILNKEQVPEAHFAAVAGQAAGLYSKSLPLIPIFVTVNSASEEYVDYTIHYFPFGSVEMTYNETDGFNIEKPLTNF